jgi:hypothetical protein
MRQVPRRRAPRATIGAMRHVPQLR